MKGRNLNRMAVDAGYHSYEVYLKSDHWRRFREDALRASPRCRICGLRSAVAHHVDYSRLGRELASDVVALCADCHDKIHVVHREHSLPLHRFSEAAKHVRRVRKDRPKRRPPRVVLAPAPKPVVAPSELALFGQRDQIRRLVVAGYSAGWISRRYQWELGNVKAMVAWIKSDDS